MVEWRYIYIYYSGLITQATIALFILNVVVFSSTVKVVAKHKLSLNLSTLLTCVFIIEFSLRLNVGPRMFDYIALCCSILIIESHKTKSDNKFDYLNVVLFSILSVVFINLHSTLWLMIFAFPIIYLIFNFNKYNARFISLLVIFGSASGFLNPYGLKLVLNSPYSMLFTNDSVFKFVTELDYGTRTLDSFVIIVLFVFVMLFAIFKLKNGFFKQFVLNEYFIFAALAFIMTMKTNRNVVILTIVICLLIAFKHKDLFCNLDISCKPIVNICLTSLTIFLAFNVSIVKYGIIFTTSDPYNQEADNLVSFIQDNCENTDQLRIYNSSCGIGEGEYLTYALRSKFFKDNRIEMTFKIFNNVDDSYKEFGSDFDQLNKKYNFNLALLYSSEYFEDKCKQIEQSGWKLIYQTDRLKLYCDKQYKSFMLA